MAFCTKCGAAMAEGATFCSKCGQAQGGSAGAPGGAPAAGTQSGLAENVAALLSYVLGWVTGLIFLLTDKRPYVQFHAAQSIVVFGALHVATIVLGFGFGMGSWMGGSFSGFTMAHLIYHIVQLAGFILWILLMVKAYQGERFKVPFAGDIAEGLVKK